MKKRVKMIVTIACICLAIGVLSFGVYSATAVSFSVTTNVSYKLTSLYLDIDASVSGGNLTSPLTYKYNSVEAGGNPSDTLTWNKDTTSGNGVAVSATGGIANLSFAQSETGKSIVFAFTFTNRGEKPITGSITANYPSSKVTQSIEYSAGSSISIASKGSQTVTITYTLKSFGFSLNSESISMLFDFSD